jgi:hypothetical protein
LKLANFKRSTSITNNGGAVLPAKPETNMNAILEKIAQNILDLDTLETRRSDELDFHDLAVWQLKAALEAAYKAGAEVGITLARS